MIAALNPSASDISAGVVILLMSLISIGLLAKKIRVSAVPVILVTSCFFLVGSLLYIPSSPVFIPSDASYYQEWGYALSDHWAGNDLEFERQLWPGKGVWPLVIGVFHFFLGPIYVTPIAFNSGVFGFMILTLQKSILLFSGKSGSWVLGFLVATSAPYALFGPSILRESLFWLGISSGVLGIAYLARSHLRNGLLSLTSAGFLLLAIRPDAGVVIAYSFACLAIVLVGLARETQSVGKKILVAVVLIGFMASFVPVSSYLFVSAEPSFISESAANLSTPEVTTGFAPPAGTAADRFADERCTSLAFQVLCRSLMHLPSALFGPFYWEYGPSAIWWISGMSTLHFLLVAALAFSYVFSRAGRGWVNAGLIGVASVSFLMFSSIMTNYGILIRFRAATEVILTPFAVLGYLRIFSRQAGFSSAHLRGLRASAGPVAKRIGAKVRRRGVF